MAWSKEKPQTVTVTPVVPKLPPAQTTADETMRTAEIVLGYILRAGHWGMAIITSGIGFATVAMVTRLDALTERAMSGPEFGATLAFSAVLVVVGACIHVSELRHRWVDPYEVSADQPATATLHGQSGPDDQSGPHGDAHDAKNEAALPAATMKAVDEALRAAGRAAEVTGPEPAAHSGN